MRVVIIRANTGECINSGNKRCKFVCIVYTNIGAETIASCVVANAIHSIIFSVSFGRLLHTQGADVRFAKE